MFGKKPFLYKNRKEEHSTSKISGYHTRQSSSLGPDVSWLVFLLEVINLGNESKNHLPPCVPINARAPFCFHMFCWENVPCGTPGQWGLPFSTLAGLLIFPTSHHLRNSSPTILSVCGFGISVSIKI